MVINTIAHIRSRSEYVGDDSRALRTFPCLYKEIGEELGKIKACNLVRQDILCRSAEKRKGGRHQHNNARDSEQHTPTLGRDT
ncbi:hypothetical protein ACN38_g7112 [Penicillium nordicum]|uniref:Uncharacterized protein n=1 Tax=Penicillium nordicum TaxID=229535 RepID=A0A0M8P615_9EURO|nr:hypothetical protein ACN38_g7112 [Penicillium nordicum]